MTKQRLSKLEDEGDITPVEVKTFYLAVRAFYITATEYAFANLPLKDDVLQFVKIASLLTSRKGISMISHMLNFLWPGMFNTTLC